LGYPSQNRRSWESIGAFKEMAIPAMLPPPMLMPPVPPPSSLRQLGEGHPGASMLAVAEFDPLRQAAAHRCQAVLPAAPSLALADELLRQADRGMLDARILGDALWTMSVSRDSTSSLRRLLPVITERLLGRSADLDGHGVVSALWAAAVFRDESPVVLAMLPVLIERLILTLNTLQASDASLAFVALSALRDELGRLGLKLSKVADALATRFLEVSAGTDITLEPWLLGNFLWALPLSGLKENMLVKLMPLLAAHADERSEELEPQHVATMFWAAAVLRGVGADKLSDSIDPQDGPQDGKALSSARAAKSLAALLVRRLPIVAEDSAPEDLATVLWAMGVCFGDNARTEHQKARLAAASASMLDGIHLELACALDSVGALELSLAVWGLAVLEYRNKELLEVAAYHALFVEKTTKTSILAVTIPRMVWAFARLDVLDVNLLRAAAEHFQTGKRRLWYLKPGAICALLWAFDCFDLEVVRAHSTRQYDAVLELQMALEAKLEEYFEGPDKEEVAESAISTGQHGSDITMFNGRKPTQKPAPEVVLEKSKSVYLSWNT